jgi:hypothetical protein
MDYTLDQVRRMAQAWRDDVYTDKLFQLRLFSAGDEGVADVLLKGQESNLTTFYRGWGASSQSMPDYPTVVIPLGQTGVANEIIVNARINLQSIVYADPEFSAVCDSIEAVDMRKAYVRQVWEEKDVSSICYECGMDLEILGIAFAEIGIGDDMGLEYQRIDPLDVLYDNAYRNPSQWRGIFIRKRLPVDDAIAKYDGIVDADKIREMCVQRSTALAGNRYRTGQSAGGDLVLHEYHFYSRDQYCCFLSQIDGEICLSYDEDFALTVPGIGYNPFGCIPIGVWWDSWVPGSDRPAGKAENVWRMATMAMALDFYERENLARALPMNFVASHAFDAKVVNQMEEARGVDDLEAIIVADTADLTSAFMRVPAGDLPPGIAASRQRVREQMNAATGVMDSQRGVVLPGERSATEYRTTAQAQGVQARHARKRFAQFVRQLIVKGCQIGALYDSKPRILNIPQGAIDTRYVPLKSILDYPMDIIVDEAAMKYLSEDERFAARVARLQAVDMAAIQSGVAKPLEVFQDVYRDIGDKDAAERILVTQEELDQKAQEEAMMAQFQQMQGQGV